MHRSRLCHFVIDVSDLDQGVFFSTLPKSPCLKIAATYIAGSVFQTLRYESFSRRPATKRSPKNACTLT